MTRKSYKYFFPFFIIIVLFFNVFSINIKAEEFDDLVENKEYYEKYKEEKKSIYIYNWGEYISIGDDELIDVNYAFEKLTGIKVYYTTFATNEELYAKLKNGGVSYDIIIPSDYMVGQLISEGMIQKLRFDNIPNYKYISEEYKNLEYDSKNEYSVPYTWGLVGIFYNKKMVDGPIDSWEVFWDEKYTNNMIMFYNPRDTFGIAQKLLGYSFNTEDEEELEKVLKKLKEQKYMVQSYLMDEIFNKMNNQEAAIAPYYNGDAKILVEENEHVEFVFPKEGTNMFVDAICIPSNSENQDLAEMYINFLCEPKVALDNSLAIGYATPNSAAYNMLDDEVKNNKIFYPDKSVIEKAEVYKNLSSDTNSKINKMWIELMREDGKNPNEKNPISVVSIIMILSIIIIVILPQIRKRKRKKFYD